MKSLILLVVLVSGCSGVQKKIDEYDPYICDDGSLSCTCMDPVRHLNCLEPTDPHDVAIFGPGAARTTPRVWRRSDLPHLSRKSNSAGPSAVPSASASASFK